MWAEYNSSQTMNKIFSALFKPIFIAAFFLMHFQTQAQVNVLENLKKELHKNKKEDTVRLSILHSLAEAYKFADLDSCEYYSTKFLDLSKKINNAEGIGNAKMLLAIIEYRKGNPIKAIAFCEEALQIFEEEENLIGQANALKNIGNIYSETEKTDEALTCYFKALEIGKKVGNKTAISDYLNNIGNLYRLKSDYKLCLQYLFEGLSLREQLNDSLKMEVSLGNISGVYFDLKKLEDAEKYGLRAYQIQKNIGDKEGLFQTSIILGSIYSEQKKYNKAIKLYEEALEYSKDLRLEIGESIALSNLGDMYTKLKDTKKAIDLYQKSILLTEKNGDIRGISVNKIGIGHCYVLEGKYKESISYLEDGYQTAIKINNLLSQLDATEQLAIAYEKLNQPYRSIYYHKIYKKVKEELFTEETSNKAQQLEFAYLLEKKQNEISLLEKEKSLQKAKSNFNELLIISLISLVIALAIIAGLINRNRVKATRANELILNQKAEIINQTKNLEELNLFKDKTFSILSHDLRTPISNLNGLLQLMDIDYLSETDFKLMTSKLKEQFKSLHILVENTLNWAKTQMHGELEPAKEMVKISEIAYRNFELFKENSEQKNIETIYTETEEIKALVDPNHIDIILRNLILNAIKFTHQNGKVQVHSYKQDDRIFIEVKDNGKGMNKEKVDALFNYDKQTISYGTAGEKGAGIGLILTHEILLRNNGTINITSEENIGSTFCISFPNKN